MRYEAEEIGEQDAPGAVALCERAPRLPPHAPVRTHPVGGDGGVKAEDYLGLVHHFAARYGRLARARNIPVEDLIGEGTFALLRAAREWRAGGAKFSTFASRCIQCRIWKLLRCKSYRWRLCQFPGDEAGEEPCFEDQALPGPAETAGNSDALAWVQSTMARVLTGREAEVICFRHGLQGERPRELGEIADALGVSHQRVSQLYGVAIGKLRRAAGQADPTPVIRRRRLLRPERVCRRPAEPTCTLRPRSPLTAAGRRAPSPCVAAGPAVRTTPGGMA
jgi:RNA polymerase sigma factor (sigma-70 family)